MADATRIHHRTCTLCEVACGLEVHHTDDRVTLIRPNRDDVWSKGHICPKGTVLGHLHHDPDRLRVPMIREGDRWREVDWDTAFRRCEELLHAVRSEHGIGAMTAYVGNPTAHNMSLARYTGLFTMLAGLQQGIYSAGTVDQWPRNVVSTLLYGQNWTFPGADIFRTDLFVMMGGNPQASQGSLIGVPDVLGEMDALRERGGRCIVVDPRRTGTCDHADEWIPIYPGTDAHLLLGVVNVLFADGLVDLGGVVDLIVGVDELRRAVEPYTPDAVAGTCRVPAARIRQLAHEIAGARRAVVHGRIGLCNQEFGTVATWLVDAVNILTANFDTPGGAMFGKPVGWSMAMIPRPGAEDQFGRWHSRVRGAPEVLGQVPVSCLAEEIATPGPGQIKALVTIAGNPVISSPDAGKLDAALPLLDAMISIDSWLNETTRHAHVILPGLSALEQPVVSDLIASWQMRSVAKCSPALFPPPPDRPREWETLLRVGAMVGGMCNDDIDVKAIDDGYFSGFVQMQRLDPAEVLAVAPEPGPERLADLAIRTGPWGDRYGEDPDGLTLAKVAAVPAGIDFGPAVPRIRELLHTRSGCIDVAPPYIVADLDRVARRMKRPDDGLVLVSRRHVRSNNSWMHNVKVLVKGKDRCTLLIHPDDAARCGVIDGALAAVSSEAGSIEVPVEVSDEMMPGVVSLPHGWGHNVDGVRLSVAKEFAGVNSNLIAPGHLVDEISGNAIVNGFPVEVAPA